MTMLLRVLLGTFAAMPASAVTLKVGGHIQDSYKKAFQLWVDWANAQSGANSYNVTTDIKTYSASAMAADIAKMTDVSNSAHVDALICPYGSARATACVAAVNKTFTGPVFAWGGALETIFSVDCEALPNRNCFGFMTVDKEYTKSGLEALDKAAKVVKDNGGPKAATVAVIFNNNPFSKAVAEATKKKIESKAHLSLQDYTQISVEKKAERPPSSSQTTCAGFTKTLGSAVSGNSVGDKVFYQSVCECASECAKNGACAGFVDNYESVPPYCILKTSTSSYPRAGKNFFSKDLTLADTFAIKQALDKQPDIVVITGHNQDVEPVIIQIGKYKHRPQAILATNGISQLANYGSDGQYANCVMMPSQWDPASSIKDEVVGWNSSDFIKKMGGFATYQQAAAGAVGVAIANALAKDADKTKLVRTLEKMDKKSFYGKLKWDHKGKITKGTMFTQQKQASSSKIIAPGAGAWTPLTPLKSQSCWGPTVPLQQLVKSSASGDGKIKVKVQGKSGMISVYSEMKGLSDPNKVTIQLKAVREVDAAGNEVGTSSAAKHSRNSFAANDFWIDPLRSVTIGASNPVSAGLVSLSSNVSTVGHIKVDTYILTASGKVGPVGELWPVKAGDVKFNIALYNWNFCGCKNGSAEEIGKFVDVDIKIKGKSPTLIVASGANKYAVGGDYGGVNLTLTNKVIVDGVQSTMPLGYPKLQMKEQEEVLTFRFPRFSKTAVYDPLLSTAELARTTTTTTTTTTSTTATTTTTSTTTPENIRSPDFVHSGAGVKVKVLGRSGKFSVYSKRSGVNDTNKVTVELDALREIDAAGNTVGTMGKSKHSINTFAAQDFAIDAVQAVTLGANKTVNGSLVSFSSYIPMVGSVKVGTYIITSSGMVGPVGELWPVVAGDVKFNIQLQKWNFCGQANCKKGNASEIGEFVEIDIKIKGKHPILTKASGANKNKYRVGGNIYLQLTNKITVDGVQTTMPADYPKLKLNGKEQVFTFRLPKFTNAVFYDSLLSTGTVLGEVANRAGVGSSLAFSLVVALLTKLTMC